MHELSQPIDSAGVEAIPFYVVCDISSSMWDEGWKSGWGSSTSPWRLMSQEMVSLIHDLNYDQETRDVVHISVIEFAHEAEVVLRLARVSSDPELRPLGKGTWTNFVAAWELLAEVVVQDIQKLRADRYLPARPTIFFITDGKPGNTTTAQTQADWGVPYDRLARSLPGLEPRVVAIGIGQPDESVLLELHSKNPHGAAVRPLVTGKTSTLVNPVISQIRKSVRDSTVKGTFQWSPPEGMRSLCKMDRH